MKHILINLPLLPFRVAWDAFLILATVVIVIFCVCAVIHLFGFFIFMALLITEPVALLLPFTPLLFLKHPWPQRVTYEAIDESKESSVGKWVQAFLL